MGRRATARTPIHNQISRIRSRLGNDAILTEPAGYSLTLTTDMTAVVALLRTAETAAAATDWEAGSAIADEALAYWRGPPLEELGESVEARDVRRRMYEVRNSLESLRLEAAISFRTNRLGDPGGERLVADAPQDEHRWALLMRALELAGRRGDALGALERGHSVVITGETGIDMQSGSTPVSGFVDALTRHVASAGDTVLPIDDLDRAGPTTIAALQAALEVDGVMLLATADEADLQWIAEMSGGNPMLIDHLLDDPAWRDHVRADGAPDRGGRGCGRVRAVLPGGSARRPLRGTRDRRRGDRVVARSHPGRRQPAVAHLSPWCRATPPLRRPVAGPAYEAERLGGSSATRRHVLPFAYLGIGHPTDLEHRERLTDELLELAREADGPVAIFEGLQLSFSVGLQRARGDQVRSAVAEVDGLIDRVGDVGRRWSIAYQHTAIAHLDGDLETAERKADEALGLFASVSPSRAVAAYGGQMLVVRLAQGRLDELTESIEILVADQLQVPAWNAALVLAVAHDDPERARAHASAAIAGDEIIRGRYVERLGRWSGLVCWQGTCSYGPVDTVLGLLARSDGRTEAAAHHFAAARQQARALGAPVFAHELNTIESPDGGAT